MKDLEYSLIDCVNKELQMSKEYVAALKIVQRNLRKGNGSFEIALTKNDSDNKYFVRCGVADQICELGFEKEILGRHQCVFSTSPNKHNYLFTVKKKLEGKQ